MSNGDVTKQEIRFDLSKVEVEDRKNQLIDVERKIDDEVDAKSAEMAERNAALKELRKDRKRLLEACHSGVEKREVEVREEWDFQTNRVKFIRLDTGTQVDERAMTGTERQEDMFGEPPPAATSKKKTTRKKTSNKSTRASTKGGLHAVD